jgi:hypothetical protein
MNKETQALANLYQASSLAKLSAQEHQLLAESAKTLEDFIKANEPKQEVKEDNKK